MPPELPDAGKVVFGELRAPNGFRVLAYDVPGAGQDAPATAPPATRRENGMTITTAPFFLAVSGDSADEVGEYFGKLAADGSVVEAFGPSQWSPGFGMVTDRFGVTWVLDVAASR